MQRNNNTYFFNHIMEKDSGRETGKRDEGRPGRKPSQQNYTDRREGEQEEGFDKKNPNPQNNRPNAENHYDLNNEASYNLHRPKENREFGSFDEPDYRRQRGERRPYQQRTDQSNRRPYNSGEGDRGERRPYNPGGERTERRPYNSGDGERRPFNSGGERDERKPYNPGGERRPYNSGGERRPYNSGEGERRPYNSGGDRDERRPYNSGGDRRPYNSGGDRGERRPYNSGGDDRRGGYSDRRPQNRDQRPYQDRQRSSYSDGGNQGGYRSSRPYEGDRPRRPRIPREQFPPVEQKKEDNGLIRINKFIANSGHCSRREADEYIQMGLVEVNGKVVDVLGTKISITDEVKVNGTMLQPEKKVYVLLNKPKDYVTTTDDPYAEHTVLDLIKDSCKERVYPVGRLDRNSTGVLLLTNDGELASNLLHPKFKKRKVYHVGLDKDIENDDLKRIQNGLQLPDGWIKVDAINFIEGERNNLGIELHSGRNRIIRRIFEFLGYKVNKLDRVYFAGLTKKGLRRGQWRFLTKEETIRLKMNSFT